MAHPIERLIVNNILEVLSLNYDESTGNLLSRKRNNSTEEAFGYDCLDRLVSADSGGEILGTVYAGDYEKVTDHGVTREFYYLDANTIVIKQDGVFKPYVAFTDNLGSILAVVDEDGSKVFEATYDAWGRQTVALNKIGLQRGYCGHEMMNRFGLINMNGRLYDPDLGRFLSPDNYVQMPDNSQNFNRYSYCLNNPLKYTDPTGEIFGFAFAAFSMAGSMMRAAFDGKSVLKAGALGILSSAASYGVGEIFKNATMTFGNELLRAGAHGLASGVISALDGGKLLSSFVSGAAASGIGSFVKSVHMGNGLMLASTTAMGGFVAWATGGDILQGAMQGLMIGALNHMMHEGDDIKYYRDNNGDICGDIPEVVIVGQANPFRKAFVVANSLNIILGATGESLKRNSGNSTYGSNGRIYWNADNQRGFYGNQYVNTVKLSSVGKGITKVTGPIGNVMSMYDMYKGYEYDDNTIGYYTVKATADWAGGLAGG